MTIVDLRLEPDWVPRRLVSGTFRWPVSTQTLQLDEIGTRIQPRLFVEQGSQVIVPEGIDRVHGGIRRRTTKYQGAGHLVGGEIGNLQPGDVLIPARADLPALMLHADLAGSTVSGGFSAFRFTTQADAYWVWAVFSSVAGRDFRRAFLSDSSWAKRPRVGDAALPWPDEATRARMLSSVSAIESQCRGHEESAVATWWNTTDLRRTEWRIALATPEPERLFDGVPLADLAIEIRPGRAFNSGETLTAATDGALPVVTGATLAGRPITRWLVETSASVVAEAGDLLVAVVGKRANARIVEQRSILDSGVYRVRLAEARLSTAVAAFFNGQTGYGLRSTLLFGTTIPRVSVNDLRRMRIPESVLRGEAPDRPTEPLAERLERLLWSK
ncbi:hypothetical protein [Arthrobacter sp. zg-Y1116]|uniref:hypothetical protein n=1 Tax=Arthrobacter sp. zg-Y1116 TaxID=2964611 RepID=UPI00210467CF|nr:hypothetical protein [Arthrobacter sp. zg-Y1116]MCQ1947586.1 hypothetical protein [Arthrobacter sp. zg-Y1116]